MVNEGWDFPTLMAMRPGEFGFWFDTQARLAKAKRDALRPKGKRDAR